MPDSKCPMESKGRCAASGEACASVPSPVCYALKDAYGLGKMAGRKAGKAARKAAGSHGKETSP